MRPRKNLTQTCCKARQGKARSDPPESGTMIKSKITSVKFEDIILDNDRNPRMDSSFNIGVLKDEKGKDVPSSFISDIFTNGLRSKPVCSERQDKSIHLLQGHRRMTAVTTIRKQFPKMFETIEVIVFTGLSETEELDQLIDHGQTQNLNNFELYRAVKSLTLAGFSEEKVMGKLGLSRGMVQKYTRIMKGPAVMEASFRAHELKEKTELPLMGVADIVKLASANYADSKTGKKPEDPGSEFAKAWGNLTAIGKVSSEKPIKITFRDLEKAGKLLKSKAYQALLNYLADNAKYSTEVNDWNSKLIASDM